MVINLITFASILHKQASVRSSHEVILTELEKYFTVNFIDYKDIDKLSPDDFSIIFIATGGVERLVIQHFESLPRPAILLADGMQNSLAAALEISSWLRGRGMKSEILHGELPETIKRIFVLHSNFVAQRSLFGMRIGVMGTPSSWLVASNVDYLLAKRRWGIEYTDVSLDRIYEYYGQITDDEVGEACAGLAGNATGTGRHSLYIFMAPIVPTTGMYKVSPWSLLIQRLPCASLVWNNCSAAFSVSTMSFGA